jgi:hypothetical protein
MTTGKPFIQQTLCVQPELRFINLQLEMNALSSGPDIHIRLKEHAFAPSAAAAGEVKLSKGCLVCVESVQEEFAW